MKRLAAFLLPAFLVAALAVAAAQRQPSMVIPAGTQVTVRISNNLSSEYARAGDSFRGSLVEPIVVDGRTVFPAGSEVTGRVLYAHPSGRLSDPGVLDLGLTSISSDGRTAQINTDPFRIKGESHTKSNVTKIGGMAAAGAIIGAIAGGGKGAAIGAGAGAAAGTGMAAATGKKDAKVEAEAVLSWTTSAESTTGYAGEAAPPPSRVRSYDEQEGGPPMESFSSRDRRAIRTCFQQNESNLPPGLAKRESLPPGLEGQLERNGTLPPGLQKRVQPLPDVCENQLAPLAEGLRRVVYARRVMLIDQDYRILDIFNLDQQ